MTLNIIAKQNRFELIARSMLSGEEWKKWRVMHAPLADRIRKQVYHDSDELSLVQAERRRAVARKEARDGKLNSRVFAQSKQLHSDNPMPRSSPIKAIKLERIRLNYNRTLGNIRTSLGAIYVQLSNNAARLAQRRDEVKVMLMRHPDDPELNRLHDDIVGAIASIQKHADGIYTDWGCEQAGMARRVYSQSGFFSSTLGVQPGMETLAESINNFGATFGPKLDDAVKVADRVSKVGARIERNVSKLTKLVDKQTPEFMESATGFLDNFGNLAGSIDNIFESIKTLPYKEGAAIALLVCSLYDVSIIRSPIGIVLVLLNLSLWGPSFVQKIMDVTTKVSSQDVLSDVSSVVTGFIVSVFCSGERFNFQQIMEKVGRLPPINRIRGNVEAILEFVSEVLQRVCNAITGLFGFKLFKDYLEPEDYFTERVNAFLDAMARNLGDGVFTPEHAENMIKDIDDYLSKLPKDKVTTLRHIEALRCRVVQARTQLQNEASYAAFRTVPVCIALVGDPGIGKTHMCNHLTTILAYECMNSAQRRECSANHDLLKRQVWAVPKGQKHEGNGYQHQFVTYFDDFALTKEETDQGMTNEQFIQLVNWINCNPYSMNTAELERKGNTYFDSQFVVLTTNNKKWRLSDFEANGDQVLRRVHLGYKVSLNLEYAKVIRRDGKDHNVLDVDKLKALPKSERIRMPHLAFTKHNFGTGSDIGEPISFPEFMVLIRETRKSLQVSHEAAEDETEAMIHEYVSGETFEFTDCPCPECAMRFSAGKTLNEARRCVEQIIGAQVAKKVFDEAMSADFTTAEACSNIIASGFLNDDSFVSKIEGKCPLFVLNELTKVEFKPMVETHPNELVEFCMWALLRLRLRSAERFLRETGTTWEKMSYYTEKHVMSPIVRKLKMFIDFFKSSTPIMQIGMILVGYAGAGAAAYAAAKGVQKGFSAMKSYTSTEEEDVQSQYKMRKRPKANVVVSQAHKMNGDIYIESPTHTFGSSVIRRDMVFCAVSSPNISEDYTFFALIVGNDAILANKHFLANMKRIVSIDPSASLSVTMAHRYATTSAAHAIHYKLRDFMKKAIFQSIADGEDALLMYAPGFPHRDVSGRFMEGHLPEMGGDGMLCCASRPEELMVSPSHWKWAGKPTIATSIVDGKEIDVNLSQNAIIYDIATENGVCGAPYIVMEKGRPVIAGIHAGGNGSHGYAVPLTQALVRSALIKLMTKVDERQPQPIEKSWAGRKGLIDCNDECEGVTAQGQPIIGECVAISMPENSALRRTPLYRSLDLDLIGHKRPAQLRRTAECDPLADARAGYGIDFVQIPSDIYDAAAEAMASVVFSPIAMLGKARPKGNPFSNFEEAVTGYGIVGPLSRKTSPGYPAKLIHPGQGKKMYFGDGEVYDFDYSKPALKELVHEVYDLIENADYSPVSITFYDFLKDELRKPGKVTRMISSCPVEASIAMRMAFIKPMEMIQRNRVFNGIALGINPYQEWDMVVKHLGADRPNMVVMAGDYGAFDKSTGPQHAQLMEVVCKIASDRNVREVDLVELFPQAMRSELANKSKPSVRVDRVRHNFMKTIVNSVHIARDMVVQWAGSNPSGQPLTTPYNSLVNLTVLIVAIYMCSPLTENDPASIRIFISNLPTWIKFVVYGDDHLFSFERTEQNSWLNYGNLKRSMKALGFTYTDENKSESDDIPDRKIHEVTFLKRGFRMEDGYWFAPLDIDSIMKPVFWTRCKTDAEWVESLKTVWMELSAHGEKVYEEYVEVIEAVAGRADYPLPMTPSFALARSQYLCCTDYY